MCGLSCNQPGLGELECKNCHRSICRYTAHSLLVVGLGEGRGRGLFGNEPLEDWSANTVGN